MDRAMILKELTNGTEVSKIIDMMVNDEPGLSRDAARKRIRRVSDSMNKGAAPAANTAPNNTQPPVAQPSQASVQNMQPGQVKNTSTTVKANGERIFTDLVRCFNGTQVKPEDLMKAHNLDPNEWDVVNMSSSFWEAQFKGGVTGVMESVKMTVKPRSADGVRMEDVTEYFNKIRKSGYQIPQVPVPAVIPSGDDDGVILELDIADIHIGLLAWRAETGKDFDMKIVTELFKNANMDLFRQVKNNNVKVKEVKIITLGDVLHVDNDHQTTTKGTFQQVDGRLPKIFDCAVDLMVWCISLWEQVAPVEYIYIRGNHDQVLGYAVAKSVSLAFKNHPTIKCDIEPNPHKYRKLVWGKKGKKLNADERSVMVVFSHGDMNKANLEALPYTLANHEMNGVSKRYIHVGHLHNQNSYTTRDGGTEVTHIDSFCYGSYWEHQQGYGETESLFLNMFMWRRNATRPNVLIGDSSIAYK